jgi:succinate-acetate transporter protein
MAYVSRPGDARADIREEEPAGPRTFAHREIADPAPLGLGAFAMTTVVLSVVNGDLIPTKLAMVVLPLALFYGGLAQLLAGMWEFVRNNTFGALAFSSYGAFWLAYAGYARFIEPTLPKSTAYQATGLFLAVWGFFTLYMIMASLRTTAAVAGVFITLFATYGILASGALMQNTQILKIGGYVGILTGAIAWYASFAGVTNATWKRTILPTGPLELGRVHGDGAGGDGQRAGQAPSETTTPGR